MGKMFRDMLNVQINENVTFTCKTSIFNNFQIYLIQ